MPGIRTVKRKLLLLLSFLFIVFVLIAITRIYMLVDGVSTTFNETDSVQSGHMNTQRNKPIHTPLVVNNEPAPGTGKYETIDETITRLKRDVIVTGTVTGTPGQETATFSIETMADRSFKINTQLMDGFIITEIHPAYVMLKNQSGNETIRFEVVAKKSAASRKLSTGSQDSVNTSIMDNKPDLGLAPVQHQADTLTQQPLQPEHGAQHPNENQLPDAGIIPGQSE